MTGFKKMDRVKGFDQKNHFFIFLSILSVRIGSNGFVVVVDLFQSGIFIEYHLQC